SCMFYFRCLGVCQTYSLSLHDALPIFLNYDGECNYGMGTCFKTLDLLEHLLGAGVQSRKLVPFCSIVVDPRYIPIGATVYVPELDRKSTRLNSSHQIISYAVFCSKQQR